MTPATDSLQPVRTASPCVLVVDDQLDVIEWMGDALARNVDCRLTTAANIEQARSILAQQSVDLLIVDLHLPDGSGADLLPLLRARRPLASAIIMTGSPSVESAVSALRQGAVDFLAKPFTADDFLQRTRAALHRQAMTVKSENRIDRLRDAVRRLNESRRLVTRKVDLLCNDLVNAYGELSRQLDQVRTTESFRGAITVADNLEQMLCHAMDWMLRQIGYANVAIWLAGEPGFQLAAYMKYTTPGSTELSEAMRLGLLPKIVREGIVQLSADEAAQQLTPAELAHMKNQAVLGAHCTYLGESLAQIILFRDGSKPFTEDDLATLRAIGPAFAVTLATMVRNDVDGQENQDGDESQGADGANPFNDGGSIIDEDEPFRDKPRRKKKDDADWWKRGEEPPF
jgi:DNA-binding response OmpR family regulator